MKQNCRQRQWQQEVPHGGLIYVEENKSNKSPGKIKKNSES
jgi:hypothetical protein